MPFLSFSNKDVCLQTPRKDVALKFNVSSRAVGNILSKRKEIEADSLAVFHALISMLQYRCFLLKQVVNFCLYLLVLIFYMII